MRSFHSCNKVPGRGNSICKNKKSRDSVKSECERKKKNQTHKRFMYLREDVNMVDPCDFLMGLDFRKQRALRISGGELERIRKQFQNSS